MPQFKTKQQAMVEATRRFGDRAVVGGPGRPAANWHGPDVYFVGWKECDVWQWIGTGASWDEAFASVKKVKTHYRDKLEVYA